MVVSLFCRGSLRSIACVLAIFSCSCGVAGEPLTFAGPTMGTTYMVKVHAPPTDDQSWQTETAVAIDRELRTVNDQMSTYLETSEISRFNGSDSTDWFDVSVETASVVAAALAISQETNGALDVTVGPLVDRWSFGPGERKRDVPTDAELNALEVAIGHQKLQVRTVPPALKKEVAELRVDLSAIAKGYGVDRIVSLLKQRGAENVFVEIGGEVRVSGSKGDQPWKVGIQQPDADGQTVLIAHPIRDAAMATSGDYRNFFEVDGVRYSHTIDPTTMRPVTHQLASVSVIADNCMMADAWATAFNVVGAERALELAEANDLDVLVVERSGERYRTYGTGVLADRADSAIATVTTVSTSDPNGTFASRMAPVLILTGIVFGAVLLAMAVGVIFGGKAISGSCGGLNAKVDEDGVSRCSMCSTPSEACQELRDKMAEQ